MPIEQLIKRLQQYQKRHLNINVYITDSQGDDTTIYRIFYTNFNNYNGKDAIIISNGNSHHEYNY